MTKLPYYGTGGNACKSYTMSLDHGRLFCHDGYSTVFAVRPVNLREVSYIYATHECHSGMQHSYDW